MILSTASLDMGVLYDLVDCCCACRNQVCSVHGVQPVLALAVYDNECVCVCECVETRVIAWALDVHHWWIA